MLLASLNASAQSAKVPPLKIVQSNGELFRAHNLPMDKPIIIVYFSPGCDHCDILTKELLRKQEAFRKASVVMVTWQPVEIVATFVQQYQLAKHRNIYVGTEGTSFFVKNYYKIEHMPFMALYTKNGDFVQRYSDETKLPALLQQLGKLN
ncbi:MAG: hypothetical protein V4717_12095 [Bacteroidota bacterium]